MASSSRHPDDIDPTGVRDLLASLPDPGPMPEDLVRRIQARLEVERAGADAPGRATSGASVARADHVFDLAAERSRRRPGRTVAVLGAAAAGLLVTTVAVTQLVGGAGSSTTDTAAVYPSLARGAGDRADEDVAGDRAGGDAEGEEGAEAGSGAGEDAEGGGLSPQGDGADAPAAGDDSSGGAVATLDPELGGRVAVLPDLGAVDDDDLARSLDQALDTDVHHFAAGDLTLDQARSCWQVLAGSPSFEDYVAARAEYATSGASHEAVALLGVAEDGTGRAWVLPESCTTGEPVDPLSGPHTLD